MKAFFAVAYGDFVYSMLASVTDDIPLWAWIVAFFIKLFLAIFPALFVIFLLFLGLWFTLIKKYVQGSSVHIYQIESDDGKLRVGLSSGTLLFISLKEMRLERVAFCEKTPTLRVWICEDLLWFSSRLFEKPWVPLRLFFIKLLYGFVHSRKSATATSSSS